MRRYLIGTLLIVLATFGWLAGKAWRDARVMGPELAARADALIADGKGWQMLGPTRRKWLLVVEDPTFETHEGIDLTTPGAGITTITQSLSKRVAFDEFKPGIAKLRQTAFAMSLEGVLTKEQILALWIETAEMGRGAEGWITGFEKASLEVFGGTPTEIGEDEFLTLVAVLIAPSRLSMSVDHAETADRVARIKRLIAQDCTPLDHSDVWLEGCSQDS